MVTIDGIVNALFDMFVSDVDSPLALNVSVYPVLFVVDTSIVWLTVEKLPGVRDRVAELLGEIVSTGVCDPVALAESRLFGIGIIMLKNSMVAAKEARNPKDPTLRRNA